MFQQQIDLHILQTIFHSLSIISYMANALHKQIKQFLFVHSMIKMGNIFDDISTSGQLTLFFTTVTRQM